MKNLTLILTLLLSVNCFAQDRIIKSDGEVLDCKITSVDSSKVYFETYQKGKLIQTYLPISKTKEICDYSNSNSILVPILYSNTSGTYRYFHNGVSYKRRELEKIIKKDPVAYKRYEAYKELESFGHVFGSVGGFCLGWITADLVLGEEPNLYLLGAGVGLTLLSIPFYTSARKPLHKSIDLYNDGLNPVHSSSIDYVTSFGIKNGLLSFTLNF